MRRRIAVVGGGVTAGLAAYMLSGHNEIHLFRPLKAVASPIPEIVPRRIFFDAMGCSESTEHELVQYASPAVTEAIWYVHGKDRLCRMESTDRYFVFDKGRLAKWLFNSAAVCHVQDTTVRRIADIKGYDVVLDCRGSKMVTEDPDSISAPLGTPCTRCVYVIAARPDEVSSHRMQFWTEPDRSLAGSLTFFMIPIGHTNLSLGYSSDPSVELTHADVCRATDQHGVAIDEDMILITGNVTPVRQSNRFSLSNVVPLGDARCSPCPLTDYGILAALSTVLEFRGRYTITAERYSRMAITQPDPHIPEELFL